MGKIMMVWAGAFILLAAGWARAGAFEGEVDMQMQNNKSDKALLMKYFVKGNKIRTDIETKDGATGGGIYDWQTHQMIMFMDKQKMYMVSELHPEKFHYNSQGKHFKIHKTGNTQNILGYDCQEWDYESDDDNGKVWFAPGIGNWWGTQMAAQSDKLDPAQKAMVNMVIEQKLFPMKWESINKSGGVNRTAEATKVDKKSLDSSLFEPPAGYKELNMPKMDLGQMGNSQMPKVNIPGL